MRISFISALALLTATGSSLPAQMHKVAAPEQVVRSVSVYEWIGDRAKPNASRLIPVSLFIDGKLEDGGVYLAQPIPLALDSGTLYEVEEAGVPKGMVDLKYASHLNASGANATDQANYFDDGWFGYGTYAPPPAPKKTVALKESKRPAEVLSSKADMAKPDPDRPSFSRKPGSESSTDKSQPPANASSTPSAKPADPDNDQASNTDSSSSPSTNSSAAKPDDDPDRPHLIRKPEPASAPDSTGTPQTGTGTATGTGTVPADDPDRPTLKKRSPEEAKKARREAQESSASGLATSLNDDPNRPLLHRGKGQQAIAEADFPKLKGVPTNLHQAVAVSDAKTRPTHDFARPWSDDAEKATILAKMQEMARSQIAAYRSKPATASTPPAKPAQTGAAGKPARNSKLRHAKTADAAPQPLLDEELKGYTLSYGGAATYIYSARTDGDGATLLYVTVVAQMNPLGTLEPALQSVTDAAHLDRTPWMRLVDVVDAEASNRASLLFELRESNSRQFALYRVIAAHSEQTFLTGTTQ